MSKSKEEKAYLDRVASLGCIVCPSPAQVHHIRKGYGKGQKAPHWLTIPLCQTHHTGSDGIHYHPKIFEMRYGDELSLLAETIRRLNG